MIDQGYHIEYPPQFKWDPEKIRNPKFLDKLNVANIELLKLSLKKLRLKPKMEKAMQLPHLYENDIKPLDINVNSIEEKGCEESDSTTSAILTTYMSQDPEIRNI